MKTPHNWINKLSSLAISSEGKLQNLSGWIVNNQDLIADLPLKAVAQRAKVSETTVFRLTKILGFEGYRGLRMAFAEQRGIAKGQILTDELKEKGEESSFSLVIKNVINLHIGVLSNTAQLVDPGILKKVVNDIHNANIVHILGFGSSTAPAMDIYQRLIRFGYISSVYNDPHVLTAVTSNPPDGSLFFAISYSGQSRDIVDSLQSAKKQGLKTILITSNTDSAAAAFSDRVLFSAPCGGLVGTESVASRVSQLAIIDMICTGLALEHPNKDEFLNNANVIEDEIEKKRV